MLGSKGNNKLGDWILHFQNGCIDFVVVELCVMQLWFDIILVISKQTDTTCSFNFEINNTHGKITQFWLVKINAVFR